MRLSVGAPVGLFRGCLLPCGLVALGGRGLGLSFGTSALIRAGGVWVRQPALFPMVVRQQPRFGSQATERGEDPGLPPGERPPGGLSGSVFEG